MVPTDRRYTKEHEWIAVLGPTATVGLTDYAQRELGDIVFVELPDEGRRVKAGDVLGTVESVKAVSEIYAPVGGKVVEVNQVLNDRPELVNSSPHDEGWYCRLELAQPKELDDLLDAAAYRELIGKSAG